jgi:hypothetical protein
MIGYIFIDKLVSLYTSNKLDGVDRRFRVYRRDIEYTTLVIL